MAEKDWSYDEILTHIMQDSGFQSRIVKPLEARLVKGIKRNTYSYEFSNSLWLQIVDEAINDYADKNKANVMFEGLGSLNTIFPKKIRKELASELTDDFEQRYEEEIAKMDTTSRLAERVVKGHLKTALDQHAIVELTLYIENTEELYKQSRYMEDNLHTKIRRGVYDHSKAPKLWQYLIDQGAKEYVKEHGGSPFPKAERTALAGHYADVFVLENDLVFLSFSGDKDSIPKATLNQYGELKKLVGGTDKVVSTEERILGMQDDLSGVEGYSESWFSTEKLPQENFLEFLKSY